MISSWATSIPRPSISSMPSGNFLGPLTIQIFGLNVWDAGTEVNNIAFGAAFIAG